MCAWCEDTPGRPWTKRSASCTTSSHGGLRFRRIPGCAPARRLPDKQTNILLPANRQHRHLKSETAPRRGQSPPSPKSSPRPWPQLLAQRHEKHEAFTRSWPAVLGGCDVWGEPLPARTGAARPFPADAPRRSGHPVWVERLAELSVRDLCEPAFSTDELVVLRGQASLPRTAAAPRGCIEAVGFAAQMMEALQRHKGRISREQGHRVYKHIYVMDLRGANLGHFGGDVRRIIKTMISALSDYYTETCWKIYLLNVPLAFRAVWGIVRLWIPEETCSKVSLLGGQGSYLHHMQARVGPTRRLCMRLLAADFLAPSGPARFRVPSLTLRFPLRQEDGIPLDSVPASIGGKHEGMAFASLVQSFTDADCSGPSAPEAAAAAIAGMATTAHQQQHRLSVGVETGKPGGMMPFSSHARGSAPQLDSGLQGAGPVAVR